jgi:non-ribosomal peptide synthase protein (TIGR01720 family)
VVVHHLVMDGVSWRVLLEDLQGAYEQALRGEPVALSPKTTSFRAWAGRLSAHTAEGGFDGEIGYWTSEPRRAARPLPRDREGGENLASLTRAVKVGLDEEETRQLLQDVPKAYHTQVNDVLLAALARVLARWNGEGPVLVDVEGHGREEVFDGVDLSRTVGWFTSIYPVLLDVRGHDGEGDALKAVKEQLRAIPSRGLGHGALRWLSPRAETREALAGMPRPEMRFEYLGQFDQSVGGESLLAMAPEPAGRLTAGEAVPSHPLVLSGAVFGGRLELSWQYGSGTWHAATMQALADDYAGELRRIIAHCTSGEAGGRTASDFSFVEIDQATLDLLEGQLLLDDDE